MNNRRSGHNTERSWVAIFATRFSLEPFKRNNIATAEIGTTRMFSTALDAMKVDIWIKPTVKFLNRLYMQLKKKVCRGNTLTIDISSLMEMPHEEDKLPVLVNHLKKKQKTRETEIGWFVTMKAEHWLHLIEEWRTLKTEQDAKANDPAKDRGIQTE